MIFHKCIIIDDESHAVEHLRELVGLMPNFKVIQSYTNPQLALMEICASDNRVDLILMDINMPISGIELFDQIRHKTNKLVFVSGWIQNYACEAIEAAADAYLLKPLTFVKLAATINKLFPASDSNKYAENDYFFVKRKNDLKHVKINYKDIIAVESRQNYVMIYTLDQQVLTHISLGEMTNSLIPTQIFLKVNRSFIIGTQHIMTVDGHIITMAKGITVSIGDQYRQNFTTFLLAKSIKKSNDQ